MLPKSKSVLNSKCLSLCLAYNMCYVYIYPHQGHVSVEFSIDFLEVEEGEKGRREGEGQREKHQYERESSIGCLP